MLIFNQPYSKGDSHILFKALQDFEVFGKIEDMSGKITFEKDKYYKLPADIVLEFYENGLVVYCEKMENQQ